MSDSEWDRMGVEEVELFLQSITLDHAKKVSAIQWLARKRAAASRLSEASQVEQIRIARSAKNAAWAAAIAATVAAIVAIIAAVIAGLALQSH
jgi:uncharacterized membrane protein